MVDFDAAIERLGPVAAQTGLAFLAQPAEGEEPGFFNTLFGAVSGIFAPEPAATAAVPATSGPVTAPVTAPTTGTIALPAGLLVAGVLGLIFLLR